MPLIIEVAFNHSARLKTENHGWTMVRLSRAGQSAVVVADIVCKLEEVRRLARRRRLLFQLPLGIAGLLISNVSVITGFAIGRSVVVGFGTAFGPWLLLLCVMPTDLTAVIVAQIACIGLLNVVFVYHLLPFALTTADCERSGRAALSCDAFDVLNGYATAVVGAHLVLAGYNIVTMVHRHRTHARWLPRASLEVSWRILGSFLLCYAPTFIAVGAIELYAPLSELFLLNQNEAQASPSLRATLRFLQAAWFFTLGGLALWPPLRARAQGFLASRNEGVAAAASISELLGPSDPATLLALAKRTFRAVSCDHLQPHHLDTNEPAAEAYALSAVVPLGSIDVRAARGGWGSRRLGEYRWCAAAGSWPELRLRRAAVGAHGAGGGGSRRSGRARANIKTAGHRLD